MLVKLELHNMLLHKKLATILAAFEHLAPHELDESKPADLLIYEMGADPESDFKKLRTYIAKHQAGEVFLMAEQTDQELLLQAIRLGAKEVLSIPLDAAEVQTALERFMERHEQNITTIKKGRLINIIGGKGGVGTTTAAVNIAASLAAGRKDLSVALLDLNMLFGEIPLFLGITPKHDWGEVMQNIARMDKTFLSNMVVRHDAGVDVLASPRNPQACGNITAGQVERLLGLMRKMYDFIIIDGGQSINHLSLKALEISDLVILVALQTLPCLNNVNKLLKTFDELGYPRAEQVSILMNRYQKRAGISLQEAESCIHKKILWTVPNDYRTTLAAINQGVPLAEVASGSAVATKIQEISNVLLDGEQQTEKGRDAWKTIKETALRKWQGLTQHAVSKAAAL